MTRDPEMAELRVWCPGCGDELATWVWAVQARVGSDGLDVTVAATAVAHNCDRRKQ